MGIFTMRRPKKRRPESGLQFNPTNVPSGRAEGCGLTLVPEEMFRKVLSLERKRSERSGLRFALMLVHAGKLLQAEGAEETLGAIIKAISVSTRETDLSGWYEN